MTREEKIIARAEEAEKETTFSDIVLKAKGVCSAYGIGFLEGAKWTDEHPKDEEPKNKDFEDFVESYMNANDDDILHYYDRYAGLIDGTQWQKEQMLKDAINAEIENPFPTHDVLPRLHVRLEELECYCNEHGFKHGDKVKVIIIKDE